MAIHVGRAGSRRHRQTGPEATKPPPPTVSAKTVILSTISASTARTLRSTMVLISVLISGVAARVMGAAASASVSIDVVTTVPDVAASTVTSFRQASYRYGCSLLPSPVMLRRNMETGFMSKQTSWLMLWLIVGMTSSHPRFQVLASLPKMASASVLVFAISPANFVNPGVSIVLKSTRFHALSYGLLAVPGAWGHIAVST